MGLKVGIKPSELGSLADGIGTLRNPVIHKILHLYQFIVLNDWNVQ